MPTYEYRCSNGHQYETREGFDAPSRQDCPTCGALAKRLLFPPPIVFKGNGFYVTDSRRGSSATIADSGGTSGNGSSSDAKSSETKSSESTSSPAPASTSSDSKSD